MGIFAESSKSYHKSWSTCLMQLVKDKKIPSLESGWCDLMQNVSFPWTVITEYCVGCVDYAGQNIFYVSRNFYVGCAGQIYFCLGQNVVLGSIFLRESKCSAWVNIFEGV